MTRLVLDASVTLKWVFADGPEELARPALDLLERVGEASVALVQPPHWLAEVSAVLARKVPEADKRERAIGFFYALEPEIPDSVAVYTRAAGLAARLDHHLFDPLYHAAALEADAELVTADTAYYRKTGPEGADIGAVHHLSQFRP